MLKRILGCLCAALLLLMPVLSACGEAVQEGSGESTIAVFYVNGTKDSERVKTARYVITALNVRWPDRSDKVFARTDKAADIKKNKDNSLYSGGEWKSLTKMVSADKKDTFPNGSEPIKNQDLLEKLASGKADVWLIAPQESSENLCRNQQMADQMATILVNPESRLHLVLIGETASAPAGNDAFTALASAHPGQVEWIRLSSSFQSTELGESFRNSDIHTGDYFLASFYGTPADLEAVAVDGDAGSWTFTLPENGSVFVLQQKPFGNTSLPELYEAGQGNARSTENLIVSFTTEQNNMNNFVGILASQLPAGNYKLTGCYEKPKIYWYPKLENLTPVLDLGEETWKYGENTITLTLPDVMHRKDFIVYFSLDHEGQMAKYSAVPVENTDSGICSWQYPFSVDTRKTEVHVKPEAFIRMADGNLIWAWEGEEQVRQMEASGIEEKEGAEQEIILYYTAEAGGSVTRNWSDYFAFSTADNPQFEVRPDDNIRNRRIDIVSTSEGFTLSIPGGLQEPDEPEEGTLTLIGRTALDTAGTEAPATAPEAAPAEGMPDPAAESPSPEAAAQEETPETLAGGKTMKLTIRWSDAGLIPGEIRLIRDADSGKEVAVSKQATLTAEIPQETLEKWQEAKEQLGDRFFDPYKLRLTARIPIDNYDLNEETPFTEENGGMKASVSLTIPTDIGPSEAQLNATIEEIVQPADPDNGVEEQSRIVLQNEGRVKIKNRPPLFTATDIKQKAEIRLDGMPGSYKGKDLLDTVLGVKATGDLFSLFEDKETGKVNTVTLSISHPAGLKLNEEPLPTDKDPWKVTLEADEMLPVIEVTEPGNHEITLTASDGVNESEPFTVKLKAYSGILQIALYAGIGLAAILLLLVAFLVIRQIRKPAFDNIKIRCLVSSDENAESGREILTKCSPTSLAHFEKKGVTLTDVLILTRQPALSAEAAAAADDIIILPTKHDELNILFGKKAMEQIGRHEKREILPQGNICRLRIDNAYIQIENVQ